MSHLLPVREAEVQHQAAIEKSAAAPRGAQKIMRRAELGQSLQMQVNGRSSTKFAVLVSDVETALYIYDSEAGLEPEVVHVLSNKRGHSVDAGGCKLHMCN